MGKEQYRQAEKALWEFYECEPTTSTISLACTGTRVRIQELGEGEPVLFIHGAPNSGSTWAPLLPHLDGYRCLLVDRPGTGLSEDYVMAADRIPALGAAFVGDILDELGLEWAHVVASSFGGHLALRSAAAQPERFGRMVQMAAPAAIPGQFLPPFMKSLKSSLARTLMNTFPPSQMINRRIMRQIGHGVSLDSMRIPDAFFAWYLALGRHTDTMRNDARMIGAEILPELDSLTLTRELLGSVDVPSLFLWGTDDGFGGEDTARLVISMMPDAELVMIPEAGHLPWLDTPEVISRRTHDFIRQAPGPRPPVREQITGERR